MKKILSNIVISLSVVFFSLSLSVVSARAESREFFKCKLHEGAKEEALIALGNDFMALTRKEGIKGYSLEFLWPLFSEDISRGTFYWAGKAPNAAAIGAINDFYEDSKANEDIRKRFSAMAACESASIYMTTTIK